MELKYPIPQIVEILGSEKDPEIVPGVDGDFIVTYEFFFFVYEAPYKRRKE